MFHLLPNLFLIEQNLQELKGKANKNEEKKKKKEQIFIKTVLLYS